MRQNDRLWCMTSRCLRTREFRGILRSFRAGLRGVPMYPCMARILRSREILVDTYLVTCFSGSVCVAAALCCNAQPGSLVVSYLVSTRRGGGSAVMREVETLARSLPGISAVILMSLQASRGFYDKLGYIRGDHDPADPVDPVDPLFPRRSLRLECRDGDTMPYFKYV